ncbi:cyclin-J [Drosophila tropicalis]|uniref:cyclin-J n=1 Tax=Drosophila tropicalis TaxID=46794 RepID=UPI0035ABDAA5
MPNFELGDIFIVDKENNDQNHSQFYRLSKTHWVKDYAEDILQTMMEVEKLRRPLFYLSSQLSDRRKMLLLCQHVANAYQSTRCALHLAIYYMDRFADYYKIRPDKLYLIALVCFHIASQIENTEASVPRYMEMNNMLKDMNGMSYGPTEYKAVERKVLMHFDFELIRPTVASFVEYFSYSFLSRADYEAYTEFCEEHPEYERFDSFQDMLADHVHTLLRIADYTICIYRFGNEPPSLLAAACMATVRQFSCLPQRWTPLLAQLTSYSESVIEPYVDILSLYHYYNKISAERLNLFLNELEETTKYPENFMGYINTSNGDSGCDTTMPSKIEKIETVNIISVEQIRKPNADHQTGKDDEMPTKTRTTDEDLPSDQSINILKPISKENTDPSSNDNEKPSLKRKRDEELSSDRSLNDAGISLDMSREEFPILQELLEPTPKKHCGESDNFRNNANSDQN